MIADDQRIVYHVEDTKALQKLIDVDIRNKTKMKTKPEITCPLTPYIKKNVRSEINRLRADGVVGMGMRNLFQVTPTPPQHLALDEQNLMNYRPLFEKIATQVAAEMNFSTHSEN